jgi:hypothetical protein
LLEQQGLASCSRSSSGPQINGPVSNSNYHYILSRGKWQKKLTSALSFFFFSDLFLYIRLFHPICRFSSQLLHRPPQLLWLLAASSPQPALKPALLPSPRQQKSAAADTAKGIYIVSICITTDASSGKRIRPFPTCVYIYIHILVYWLV